MIIRVFGQPGGDEGASCGGNSRTPRAPRAYAAVIEPEHYGKIVLIP